LRYTVWTNALEAFFTQDVCRFNQVHGRGAAGTHDDTGTFVGDLLVAQAGIDDGLLHGEIGVGRRIAHKA
jgi:hypothetical protein